MKIDIKKLLPGIKENVSLKNYTTFKIGGKAKYFFVARNRNQLVSAVLAVKKLKLPFFLLGNGSNLLISDKGFKGIVLKLQVTSYRLQGNKIYSEVGISLGQLVNIASRNNLKDLEWAVGIPGTVGGAIYGNAGAFGKSIGGSIKEVEVLDVRDSRFKIYNLEKCKFGYRESIFKKNKNLIIISAKLKLKKGSKTNIKQKIKEYSEYRIKTQPLNFPSIGSIFKNPKGLLAAELIENCGLRGKRIGKVEVSKKHANFIINLGKGKSRDVIRLINLIKRKVKKKFRINLEEEIIYLGF